MDDKSPENISGFNFLHDLLCFSDVDSGFHVCLCPVHDVLKSLQSFPVCGLAPPGPGYYDVNNLSIGELQEVALLTSPGYKLNLTSIWSFLCIPPETTGEIC